MLVASTLLVALSLGAGAFGDDPAEERPSATERPRPEGGDAGRARSGLLPRKPSPKPPPSSAVEAGAAAAAPERAETKPGPSITVVEPQPAAEEVFPVVDLVIAGLRSRAPPAEEVRGADTSLEELRVRIRGVRVEWQLVGRVAGLAITVQSRGGSAGDEGDSAPRPAASAAAPAQAAASPRAPAHEPDREVASQPERPDLLSRTSTAGGDVIERTLDPSGRVTERRFDRTGRIVAERAAELSSLTLVSQRRDEYGRILQVVEDTSGAFIGVMRDPIGRFLQAWVMR